MAHKVNANDCIGCSSCVGVCPVSCISMKDGKAVIDASTCIDCAACVGVCPVSCISAA